jgi:hypothetical protein
MPDPDADPLGSELLRDYLEPLAALPQIAPHLRLNTRVSAVARAGFDKLKTTGREQAPFELHLIDAAGNETRLFARAVIDASGTYRSPNRLGSGALPALGETAHAARIAYAIPDVRGAERARYSGKRILVIGGGHSAFNTVLDLSQLKDDAPLTKVTWAIRAAQPGRMFGGLSDDALGSRGALGSRAKALVDAGILSFVTGFRVERISEMDDALSVHATDGRVLGPFDEIIAATGFRPDLTMLQELRLAIDDRNDAPIALAPLIDPNVHSCGTVPPHGVDELAHPAEPGLYIVGMKSYGRAPTFLLLTGYEQSRSVVAALAGDWEAARQVQLTLPETGVCGTDSGCCSSALPTPALITLDAISLR